MLMWKKKKLIMLGIHHVMSPKAYTSISPAGQTWPELKARICDPCKDNSDVTFLHPDVSAHVCLIISCLFL